MNDQHTIRLVLRGLIVIAVLIVLGAIIASLEDRTLDPALYLALGGALGSIGSMLSSTNATPPGGMPVHVQNLPSQPVPVEAGT